MRVCELSIDYPPMVGGIAGHVSQLSRALAEIGNQVSVVTALYPGSRLKSIETERMRVFRAPVLSIARTRSVQYILNTSILIHALRAFEGLDLIHYHNGGVDAIVARGAFGLPRVFTNHSSVFVQRYKNGGAGARGLPPELQSADFVIAPSQELEALTRQAGYPVDRLQTISNGVDPQRFAPCPASTRAAAKRRLGVDEQTLLVLCPRRLQKKNGVSYLIEAVPQVLSQTRQPFILAVAGDYPYHYEDSDVRTINELLSRHALEGVVQMLGAFPYADMPDLYAAADIVAIPSLIEATSLAGLEAMACGLAVLATNVGGLPEIIRSGEQGLLVPPGDSRALAEGLVQLLEDQGLRRQLGLAARQRVQDEFTWRCVAQKVSSVYQQVLGG